MAQHPYDRVQLLSAGVKVSGDRQRVSYTFQSVIVSAL
ncbi:hypothetical protein LN650_21170 [Klebsiella pneumoniae subsp. pneumoniae]|nr:hypothetical protein [Klebsiella pneumoniae subsp. pneumoniae]